MSTSRTLVWRNALVAAGYFTAGLPGLVFAIPQVQASAIWPPSGVALAAVMLYGSPVAPGILVGALAANFWEASQAHGPAHPLLTLLVALGIACGSTLQALFTRRLLPVGDAWQQFLDSGRSALRFVLLVWPIGCVISATFGMAVLHAAHRPPIGGFTVGWLTWWLGDVVGVLLVTPFAFIRRFRRPQWTFGRQIEAVAIILALTVASSLLFHGLLLPGGVRMPVTTLLIPPMLWMVHRFGLNGAVWANLFTVVITTWGTAADMGPFSGYGVETGLMLLNIFLLSFQAVALISAATTDETYQARDLLAVANAELQDRYRQRTNEAATTSAELNAERDFTATLMEITAALIVVLDREGRIVRFNRACEDLTGYRAADVQGSCVWDVFLLPADIGPMTQAVKALRDGQAAYDLENDWVTRDGDRVRILWSNATLTDANGQVQLIIGTGIDITRIRTAESQLQESQRQLAALLDNLPGMAYRCRNDRDWTMAFVSDGVKDLTGYPAEALLGSQTVAYNALIVPDDQEMVRQAVDRGLQDNQAFEIVYRIRRADGEVRWVMEQGTGVRDGEGHLLALEGLITDITERRSFEEQRDSLVQDLQEALRIRQEFMSIASHELKTPITSLLLAVQRLVNAAEGGSLLPERFIRSLDTIERQSRRLAGLVDTLLDVTRIQAGRLELERAPCALGPLVLDVVARLEPDATRGGSTVSVDIPSRIAGIWDRQRLDQVLTNLLSNAIKYGRGRPIRIAAQATDQHCLVTVTDEGIGIQSADLIRIFAPFERAVSVHHYGGLGLGLYIVQRIVEAHGGDIWAESTVGQGTSFHLRLPLRPILEDIPTG
jgi:PAS domain S-box-containing protein